MPQHGACKSSRSCSKCEEGRRSLHATVLRSSDLGLLPPPVVKNKLNIALFRKELEHHPNQVWSEKLVISLELGFKIGYHGQCVNVMSTNLQNFTPDAHRSGHRIGCDCVDAATRMGVVCETDTSTDHRRRYKSTGTNAELRSLGRKSPSAEEGHVVRPKRVRCILVRRRAIFSLFL